MAVQTGFKTDAAHDGAVSRGMGAGTPVLTLDGALPVEFLSPGDRVLTRAGSRRVARVEVTVVAHARMVRVSGDALGVGRPAEAVMLAEDQGVFIRDWRAKALYGQAQAVVPAARLCDGEYIRAEVVAEARLFTLVLESPEVIYAGGLELACEGVAVPA
ncbi:Hint domain-containing protein [Rhodobacter sp. KR11]|uniref:Hint domain-containing protein n=1 Tax=Rhodobacter sp. KR11 TaxID=2974588 RepID=UPI00222214D2|nr:Hint domain-containing protein [Rhodobacter sp. KR11]MCW1917985.1 Hint domain-containing protein [Rhodobacter sp. KR11]